MTRDCVIGAFVGVALRLLVKNYASSNFLDSITYSSLDQWESSSNNSQDLALFVKLHKWKWNNLFYCEWNMLDLFYLTKFLELATMLSLLVFCKSTVNCLLNTDVIRLGSVHKTSKHLLIHQVDWKKQLTRTIMCYSLNPYSVLSTAAQSTCIISNFVFLWLAIFLVKGKYYLAAFLSAFGCYIKIYPGYFILPVLFAAYTVSEKQHQTFRIMQLLSLIMTFCFSCLGLLWVSYILEGRDWNFLKSIYWHTITIADCTPQMGLYWYLFVEMFEHFREFFIYSFQLILFTLVMSLTLRFNNDPLYLILIIAFVINVLQPYHSIGELGLLLSLLPIWNHLFEYTRTTFLSINILLSALVLGPLFHYMWLQPGTANANFYFSACMVHSIGQLDCQNRLNYLNSSCAPSPRTVARKSCNQSTNNHIRHKLPSIPSIVQHSENEYQYPKPRRAYPIIHPPSEIPFCENCHALDEEMIQTANYSRSNSPEDNNSNHDNENNENNNNLDDDEESRSWVMKYPVGPWWCEDCQATVNRPEITISQLFAVLRQWTPHAQLNLTTIVEEIFRRGAHVDDRDGLTDMTLLHFAAKSGALGDEEAACLIVNYLLDEGANLEARCKWTDMTPLHYASYFDCPLLADLLIRRGADISACSNYIDQATPLHLAASQLSLGTARILIQAGDFSFTRTGQKFNAKNSKDGFNRTPYECLPPSGQLPEPLCTLRDLLAELLRPTTYHADDVDVEKTLLKLENNHYSPYSTDPNYNKQNVSNNYNINNNINNNSQSHPDYISNGVDWLVAETGYLSPRNKPAPPQTPDKTRCHPNGSTNHPVKSIQKSAISAKVTLQSMGLQLGDTVCIGPGNLNSNKKSSDNSSSSSSSLSANQNSGIHGRIGKLRFCGSVSFASGIWVGVELDKPLGRNDGSVGGIQYFTCAPKHGIFAPIGRIYKTNDKNLNRSKIHTQNIVQTTNLKHHKSPSTRLNSSKIDHYTNNDHNDENNEINENLNDITINNYKRLSNSRSTYTISSTTNLSQTDISDNQSINSNSIVTNIPINVSHITAKIDTGLRIRSPDLNSNQNFQIGDRVLVAGQRRGILRFIGETQFAPGIWYGVELEQQIGKNNGSINGIRYFDCPIGHGIFAPINRLQKLPPRPSTPQLNSLQKHDDLMTNSYHIEHSNGNIMKTWSRTPWSSTTSPMVGHAVIGRPPLPMELVNALKAVGREPSITNEEPVFYLTEGMQVLCSGEIGIIRYIGPITFADGIWLGIDLRKPRGRHDGCVAGKRYFTCRPGHGLLVRPSRVFCRGINGINLLPPALAEYERQLAANRQERMNSPHSSCTTNTNSANNSTNSSNNLTSLSDNPTGNDVAHKVMNVNKTK